MSPDAVEDLGDERHMGDDGSQPGRPGEADGAEPHRLVAPACAAKV
jgi:hypothetical protein